MPGAIAGIRNAEAEHFGCKVRVHEQIRGSPVKKMAK
jgi:hypothetical protein